MPALWLKDETRGPSGSSKDRATALVLEDGRRRRRDTVTTASTGNAAVATCIGAAAMGMRAVVFVPTRCDANKVARMEACGADVFTVDAGYAAAASLSREAARVFGWVDRNDSNALTLEGNKTVAFEIWEQLGRHVPDVVVVPVGDGATLSALAKGFREIRACGGSTCLPRLVGIQAAACQPFVRAWAGERPKPNDLDPEGTAAEGLAVTEPCMVDRTLRDVSDTNGCFLAVTEAEIRSGVISLASRAGVLAEPAAAAALAGLKVACTDGIIEQRDATVVLVTGRSTTIGGSDTPARRGNLARATLEELETQLTEATSIELSVELEDRL
jgi:threonine synthase